MPSSASSRRSRSAAAIDRSASGRWRRSAGSRRARNDYAAAARYGEELLDSARRGGDLTVAAESLHDLGRIALLAGVLDDAAQRLTESVVIARSLGLDSLAASGSRALAEVAIRRGSLLRALGYAEQAVILSMGQDDLEACAATLLLVAAEAGRAGLDDVATPGQRRCGGDLSTPRA